MKSLICTLMLFVCVSTVGMFSTPQLETITTNGSIEASMLGIRPMIDLPCEPVM